MHILEHLVSYKNISKNYNNNNKNNNKIIRTQENTYVANMLRTKKATTRTTTSYGIKPTLTASSTSSYSSSSTAALGPKNFGLMSMQLLVVLLVFLLADSGLNGLKIVTALKGKF